MTKMNTIIRASFLSVLTAAFTVASTGTFALTNTTGVVNTGDDVEIETESSFELDIEVENKNYADIHQSIHASSNTGGNEASGNISWGGGGTSIETGNATTNVQAKASANENMTVIGLGSGGLGGSNYTDVVNTGDDVEIDTETETEVDIEVKNKNYADIYQSVWTKANTGKNDANDNIGGTSILTGAAWVKSDLSAAANKNLTLIGYGGDGSGGLNNQTIVTNTGDDVEIESEASSETEIEVKNKNYLSAWQKLFGSSNSGWNDANDNIGPTEIMTGSATLASKMNVHGNTNATGIGGSLLLPAAQNLTDIVNTGDDLDVESETEVEMEVEVENKNKLVGGQKLMIMSNSGYSETNDNIGGSSVDSGNSHSSAHADFGGNENTTLLGLLGSWLNLLAL